ncbi:serine/threonine-protein kinase ZRK1-like [Quercus suber]|uniref:serine/threonine-protein kinase ZRK1-like n=1 Tax=Quercus suber TaxID=58331 RepID=UPI0032DE56B8
MAGQKGEKERERAFYENGGKLHEKLIASCNGRPIPIRSYSCEELLRATNNYDPSHIFHRDKWYNGSFEGRMISIKKYSRYDKNSLFTDIAVSAKMSTHNNVLKLIGCCLEAQVPISVYESAANGSLSGRLFNVTSDHDGAQQHQREPLSWQSRLKIAREIAHAVSYLHTAFSRPIIHRDIKSGNVFLDQNNVAKLTDFSLSISIPEGQTHVEDVVYGTVNFVCPHYMVTGYITEKVDVYGFGSFLLELLAGQSKWKDLFCNPDSFDVEDFENDKFFFAINEVVDPAILVGEEGSVVWQQLQAVLRLALICRKKDPEIRPNMVDVTKELRKIERFIL